MDSHHILLELQNFIRPLLDEQFSILEERVERKFASLIDNLKLASDQTHRTVAENQKLILNLSTPSLNTSPLSFDGAYYAQDNIHIPREDFTPTDIALAQTSRQRAVATNNIVKAAKQKVVKKKDGESVKKKKIASLAPNGGGWDSGGGGKDSREDVGGKPGGESFPLPSYKSDLPYKTELPDADSALRHQDKSSIMVITESSRASLDDQWLQDKKREMCKYSLKVLAAPFRNFVKEEDNLSHTYLLHQLALFLF